jgi:hypothetical protein
MKVYAVITGDIKNFTKLAVNRRAELVVETELLMRNMVRTAKDAQMFRGDSYQLLVVDITRVLKQSIQLICWFKLNSDRFSLSGSKDNVDKRVHLGTRLSIGIGEIDYEGKNVLDSDGEAFHLSGRNFDLLKKEEIIRLTTADEKSNEIFEILFMFINAIIRSWTPSQAETIFHLLDKKDNTQEQVAKKLKMTQPAVALSLRAARWKEVEKGLNYITDLLKKQYLL